MDLGVLHWYSHVLQGVPGTGLELQVFHIMVQLVDELLSLVDVELDVLVGHPDYSMEERHVGGISAEGVKDEFLIFDVMCLRVGERLIQ